MNGQRLFHASLVHLYLVRVVDNNIELTKSTIVVKSRCAHLCAIFHVAVSILVGNRLSLIRFIEQFHGIRDNIMALCGFVTILEERATSNSTRIFCTFSLKCCANLLQPSSMDSNSG